MNLIQYPELEALRRLISQCDDRAGHHIVWIDQAGQMRVSRLPPGETPNMWSRTHQRQVAARLETFERGNGYVGPKAARDETYLKELLIKAREAWEEAGFSHGSGREEEGPP